MSEWVFLALGSNLGDREHNLRFALENLTDLPTTTVEQTTAVEETNPLGPEPQDPYLNQMVLLETDLSPRALLEHCQRIECRAGRVRGKRWGPRTLDIDIVRYGDRVVLESDLSIPHPEIPNRDFWQREIAELEPYARG